MKNSEFLFENMGQIPDRFVLEADAALGLSGKSAHRSSHKVWRTVLIAAAIMAFMGVTAYAAGFLDLKERVAPIGEAEVYVTVEDEETGEIRDELQNVPVSAWISNGVTGAPEYQATQEWAGFVKDYEAQKEAAGETEWEDFNGDFIKNDRERALAYIYWAWDRTEMDKLLELEEKYQLRLLTNYMSVWSEDTLRELMGIGPYCKLTEREFSYAYCFEDGSFKEEGLLELNGGFWSYNINRVMSGCIYPYGRYWDENTEYEEWEYVNAYGQTVDVVVIEDGWGYDYSVTVLYERDGAFVELVGWVSFDEPSGDCDARSLAEAFADSFDLDALTTCDISGFENGVWSRDEGAESDAGRLYADFVASPEYLAGIEYGFSRGYGDDIGGQDAENARIIAEKFALTAPKRQKHMDLSVETLESLGMGQFMDLSSCWGEIYQYDNGGFCIEVRSDRGDTAPLVEYHIQYVPKGALNPLVLFAAQTQFWRFDTACGAQIALARDKANDICWAIWETDDAWVILDMTAGLLSIEAIVDSIDWTAFS